MRELGARESFGTMLGRVNLAAQLDKNLFLMKETLVRVAEPTLVPAVR